MFCIPRALDGRNAAARLRGLAVLGVMWGSLLPVDAARAVPFEPAQSWWLSGFGSGGVLVQVDSITVDTNGNGFIDPSDFTYPIPAALSGAFDHHLSPGRTVLFAKTNSGGCNGVLVHWYAIPPQPGQNLTPIVTDQCIPNGIAHQGYFDKPAQSSQRFAYVADQTAPSNTQDILWVDLVNATSAWSQFPFNPSIGFVQFDSAGTAAFVQHDLDGDNLADYTMVNLCAGSLGSFYNIGGGGLSQLGPEPAVADEVNNAGDLLANVDQPAGTFRVQFDLVECGAAPATGACCLADGGCIDGYTSGDCSAAGGTFQGVGSDCAAAACPPPPNAVLTLTKTGPDSIVEGDTITYVLQYGNSGTLAAGSVLLRDTLPSGTTFVSATGGGTFDGSSTVSWSLGTLAAGASGSVSFTVSTSCGMGGTSAVNSFYTIFGTPGGFVAGAPSVTTVIAPAVTTPLTVSASSVPQTPPPLSNFDVVTHTITLLNTLPELRRNVNFIASYGTPMEFVALVDGAGGVFTPSASTFSWSGDLGPNATASIVFTTRIQECRSENTTQTILHNGNTIFVRNDCNAVIGTVAPADTLAVGPLPIQLDLASSNLTRVIRDPNSEFFGENLYLSRPQQRTEFKLKVRNIEAGAETVSVNATLPSGYTPDGDPPFVGTPPPGASWNNATRTVSWIGVVAGFDSVCVVYAATLDSSASCVLTASTLGSSGSCSSNLSSTMTVFVVPQPPPTAHLIHLDPFQGLRLTSLADSTSSTLLCIFPEIHMGMGRAPNGDLWIAGLPMMRFNPDLLEMEILASDFATALDMDLTRDAAWDPVDGTVIWVGQQNVGGIDQLRVRRWNPQTGQITVVFDDPQPAMFHNPEAVEVDPEGQIAVATQGGVVRIDPSNPGAFQTFTDSLIGSPSSMTLDHDGNYLVNDFVFSPSLPRNLVSIDRNTGAFTLVADLNQILPLGGPMTAVAVGDSMDVYLGPQFGVPLVLHRQSLTLAFVPGAGGNSNADMAFVGGTTTDVADGDGGGGGPGDRTGAVPRRFALRPNVPNPFNPSTTIHYDIARPARVRLDVFDLRGRRIVPLVRGAREAGAYAVRWNGRDAAGRRVGSGIYFVRLEAAGEVATRKIMLLE